MKKEERDLKFLALMRTALILLFSDWIFEHWVCFLASNLSILFSLGASN
jgi:hypothetical protein